MLSILLGLALLPGGSDSSGANDSLAPDADLGTTVVHTDSSSDLPTLESAPTFPRRAAFASLGVVGSNIALAGWNRHVTKADYGYIDWGTVRSNLTHEWVWDDDNFQVNQIGHPVQGSVYYSMARANGFSYLGGLLWTTVGSVQWEYFMETEPPAINDLVTTSMGGAMLGEMTWQLAEDVSGESDGTSVGWPRRSLAFLLNPVHGMDRMINGVPRKKSPAKRRSGLEGLMIVNGRSLGKRFVRTKGDLPASAPEATIPFATTSLHLVHGDPFESKAPFEHFTLSVGLSVLSRPVSNVDVRAQLWRLPEMETEHTRHSFHFAQNFDYIDGGLYRLAASSLGAEWLGEAELGRDWILAVHVQPAAILLGAASTDYYVNVERDYNFGSGPGWKTGFLLGRAGTGSLSAFSDRYWIRTRSGADGTEVIDIYSVEIVKDIWNGFGIGLSWHGYDRDGRYSEFPDVHVSNQELRVLATYTL